MVAAYNPAVLFWSAIALICLIGCTRFWLSDVRGELRRVGSGELKKDKRTLSSKRLEQHLFALKTSAYLSGAILGVNRETGAYVGLEDRDANLHTLAIGTTGSGKTTSIGNIIESAILRSLPLLYVDGKGDLNLAHRIESLAKQQGVPFYLFSMVGPSIKYNPIAFGGYTSKKDRIVELRHWSEDHYRKIAEGYLQTVFKILQEADLSIDLYTLSQYLEPTALYSLAREMKSSELAAEIDALESKRRDIESLICEIKNIANSEIGGLFDCREGDVLTLERALKENAVVYFCLQPLAFPAYAETLGKLIINDIKSLLAAQLRAQKKIKLFAIFDEFSVFAGDQIVNLINQGRGAGVHAVLATQSLSDIQRKGGDALLGQVLNNTNNYIIQRQNHHEDAEVLANLIGTQDGFEITSQVNAKQFMPSMGTIRQIRSFIIHPDEIKRLQLGEAILVNKQQFNVQQIKVRKGVIC